MTVAVFWDIDGTLLTTARAGVFSLEDALAEVSGVRTSLQSLATAGLTDYAIAEAALRSVGHEAGEPSVNEFLRIHADQLPRYLDRRAGHVLPNVREILDDLSSRTDVSSFLLTGNIEAGAWAKLGHYRLEHYFDAGGAFCLGPGERRDIAHRALALAPAHAQIYVIGDTPYDIAAGDAIGGRTIAVATGSYRSTELAAHCPWRVLEQLPDPSSFRALLGLDPTASAVGAPR